MDGDAIKKLISGLKSGVTALEAAVGQNRYADGEQFGNPVEPYDDPDVDLGGEDGEGGSEGKKKKFIAMFSKAKGL